MIIVKGLTKKLTDENGDQIGACSQQGTDKCQIHTPKGCTNCPILRTILTQLNAYEELFEEVIDDGYAWNGCGFNVPDSKDI